MATEPGERIVLSRTNVTKRDELLAKMLAWSRRSAAKLPYVRNPSHDPFANRNKTRSRTRLTPPSVSIPNSNKPCSP